MKKLEKILDGYADKMGVPREWTKRFKALYLTDEEEKLHSKGEVFGCWLLEKFDQESIPLENLRKDK